MSVTGRSTKYSTSTKRSGSNTTTKITVEEKLTYSDGKSETKTREITIDGPPPSKEQIKALVDGGDFDQDAIKNLSLSDAPKDPGPAPKATSTQPSAKTNQTPTEFANEALKAHNEFRSKHGVSNLTLSQDLSDMAQKWADHLLATNATGHSPKADRAGAGENIAYRMGSMKDIDYDAAAATASWYKEIEVYGPYYGKEPPPFGSIPAYGHFTQVVWKDTKEMGIGKARGNGRVVVVANYRPAGNYIGDYSKNVFPPK